MVVSSEVVTVGIERNPGSAALSLANAVIRCRIRFSRGDQPVARLS